MRIKAVFFDYDDTLMDVRIAREHSRHEVARRISSLLGLDEARVMEVLSEVEARMEIIGIFDRRVWFREVVRSLGAELSSSTINELVALYWDSWISRSTPFPDTLPVLNALRGCGYRLGIITNTDGEPGLKLARIERDGLKGLFDLIIVAGDDTKSVKPSTEPFMKALSLMGMGANEAIYVGDRPESDVVGAKAVGMLTVLIDRGNSLSIGYMDVMPDIVINSLFELLQILGCST